MIDDDQICTIPFLYCIFTIFHDAEDSNACRFERIYPQPLFHLQVSNFQTISIFPECSQFLQHHWPLPVQLSVLPSSFSNIPESEHHQTWDFSNRLSEIKQYQETTKSIKLTSVRKLSREYRLTNFILQIWSKLLFEFGGFEAKLSFQQKVGCYKVDKL